MNKKLIAGVAILCGLPTLSQASGFALIEMNARGQGNAYAGAAAYTPDASTVYFNPAGMMMLKENQIAGALHLILPNASFTNDGSKTSDALGPLSADLTGPNDDGGKNAVVPNFYWVTAINEDAKFGLGVNAPFGLETNYKDEWVGRYHAIQSNLRTINVNPSLAYRLNDQWSIGAGLDIMFGHVELSSAVDFGTVCLGSPPQGGPANCIPSGNGPQKADGKVEFDADNTDDISTGFNLGLLIEVTPQTSLGISYRSEIEMKAKGEAVFTIPDQLSFVADDGLFTDSGISATVNLPASFSFSLAHKASKFIWLADVTWTGWSSFEELRIVYDNPDQPDSVTTEEWKDTMRYSVGLDYLLSDRWVLRTGLAFDETPVPNKERRTARLPGNDRTWLSLGATFMQNKTMSWDFGYSHLFIDDAEIENQFESSTAPALEATLIGDYEASVDIVSLQFNWKY